MSVLNCAGLAQKYNQHWNRKLLSLSGSVPLKMSEIQTLVTFKLVLGPEVWLELRVLASRPSISANCLLVLLLQQGFDHGQVVSRLLTVDFSLSSLFTLFYFIFLFFFLFNFLFLEQLVLGVISHAVTSVTNWWHSHKTDHRTWENEVEGSRTKWRHTAWTTHAGLMLYSWLFRVGCTVASTDHG